MQFKFLFENVYSRVSIHCVSYVERNQGSSTITRLRSVKAILTVTNSTLFEFSALSISLIRFVGTRRWRHILAPVQSQSTVALENALRCLEIRSWRLMKRFYRLLCSLFTPRGRLADRLHVLPDAQVGRRSSLAVHECARTDEPIGLTSG